MDLLKFLERTLRAAGERVMSHVAGPLRVREKDDKSIVTIADTESESIIIDQIRTFFPNDLIHSEECGLSSTARVPMSHVFVIDPLDGTANYAAGLSHFCISIARGMFLPDGSLTVLAGGIFDPVHDKCYLAQSGYGAYVNGRLINVRKPRPLSRAMIGTSIYPGRPECITRDIACYGAVVEQCSTVRRTGSAALDLALTAEGVFDCYYEVGLKPWDVAAGSLIVSEAGGRAVNFGDSGTYSIEEPSIIAGVPATVEELRTIVTRHYL